MFLQNQARSRWSIGVAVLTVLTALAGLTVGGVSVGAQTNPGTAAANGTSPGGQNCAVSTARVGSLDVTEFFGIQGGASGFQQNFVASASQTPNAQPQQTPAQRCIRLEVENPSPGDLLPVGGYVIGGFAFDPSSNQGSGISAIQVFLDDPDQGGAIVGELTSEGGAPSSGKGLGVSSARGATFGNQFTNSGFQLTVQIPSSAAGGQHAVLVTAQSGAGRLGTVAVPVSVGNLTPAVPTRTP
jgi:hypothetical protein